MIRVLLMIAVAGFINSRIVGRYGMRVISHGALIGQLVVAIAMLAAAATGSPAGMNTHRNT